MLENTHNNSAPMLVIRSQYFLYFGVLGILLPYFNLYCYHIGFSGVQIGTLSAARTLATVIFPLLWGLLADHFQIRRPIFILCQFASTAIWAFYLYTVDYHLMLIITICYAVFYAPLISFMEAFTMDLLGAARNRYGSIRAWGSFSFIIIVVTMGRLIEIYTVNIILILIFAGSLIQATLSTQIPASTKRRHPAKQSVIFNIRKFIRRPVIVFLTSAFLMLVSHGAYYAFFSIHLKKLGYGGTFTGVAWALASIAEIGVMIRSDTIFKRFSLENVLLVSFGVAAVRWLILYAVKDPTLILLSQILHAITYGAFHMASILYIDRLTPGETKTFGQALNNAVTYGFGMMVGFFLSGYLYEVTTMNNLFILSAVTAASGGLLFHGFQIKTPATAPVDDS